MITIKWPVCLERIRQKTWMSYLLSIPYILIIYLYFKTAL